MLKRTLSRNQKTAIQLTASLLVLGLLVYWLQTLLTLTLNLVMLGGGTWLAVWGIWQLIQQRALNTEAQMQAISPSLASPSLPEGLARLNVYFYQLLQENQGQVTVLDFALKANLSATQAKDYLDQKAREFNADFEGTDRGNLVYCFETARTWQVAAVGAEIGSRTPPGLIFPLNQTQLARRLSVSPGTIRRRKLEPDFAQWSQSKDPDGIPWSYQQELKQFVPADL